MKHDTFYAPPRKRGKVTKSLCCLFAFLLFVRKGRFPFTRIDKQYWSTCLSTTCTRKWPLYEFFVPLTLSHCSQLLEDDGVNLFCTRDDGPSLFSSSSSSSKLAHGDPGTDPWSHQVPARTQFLVPRRSAENTHSKIHQQGKRSFFENEKNFHII